jgi:acyl-CoA synthetase (AMP-forming)/AMP-acid ligase II
MLILLAKLRRTRLLTAAGILYLLEAVMTTGVNLMALLRVAAKLHPRRTALIDEREQVTYTELWRQAEVLAVALHVDHGVQARQKVAVTCRNHAAAAKAVFAISRLGAHVFLLNPEMSADQLLALEQRLRFDLYVHDEQLAGVFESPSLRGKAVPAYHPTGSSIDRLSSADRPRRVRLKKARAGSIVVMTGGTTGQPKAASRKPSLFAFLPPFVALLTQVHLDRYRSVYIATPMYHGFGLASVFVSVILGARMYFTRRFEAGRTCSLIASHRIQAVTLVPLMLQRMLRHEPQALAPLRCIITGGALLDPALAREALRELGPKLFNLYGTSEAGFCIMATPDVLQRKPESIGKPVQGVRARIMDDAGREVGERKVGRLCIRSAWTTSRKSWIETGDLAYRDAEGDVFLCGRVDDMIVSGGENVYPVELENVLVQHPDVDAVAVFGVPDKEFGQRLKAVVKKKSGTVLDEATLLAWLKPRVARYQVPAVIEFREELPYTPLGKLDKKALRRGVAQ